MAHRLRFAALAAVAALALGACANNDAKRSDVVNAMQDAGLDSEQADCIGDGFQAAYGDDQDLYNDVAAATEASDFDDTDEFPEGTREEIDDILAECLGEAPASDDADDEGTDGGDSSDSSDTSDTTADEG